MKILIIGGTNFIGPPLVRQLITMGHEVSVFHREKLQLTYHLMCMKFWAIAPIFWR
ncbi:MAG: hypothetical protein RMY64_16230 [Nostoc sp. DedQUE08]|uniref:hypothetical protein n=1 Tax=Nostoc sp. DedQUE08 TaxID=3075393 RepID=UPI002AD47D48|nr:hypothetical protein [Nostoc sp. DedQUE08]MDZ8067143.1 hypothetical protein [Nostoc sp. DedQUE08]